MLCASTRVHALGSRAFMHPASVSGCGSPRRRSVMCLVCAPCPVLHFAFITLEERDRNSSDTYSTCRGTRGGRSYMRVRYTLSYMFLTMRCYILHDARRDCDGRKPQIRNRKYAKPSASRPARTVRRPYGPARDRISGTVGGPSPRGRYRLRYRARVPVNIARDIIRPVARNRPVTAFAAVRVANGGDSDAAPGRRVLLCPASGPR
jgi:hypothetical protein